MEFIKDKSGRIYTNYIYWEDYKNGLYNKQVESLERINLSMGVLNNPEICYSSMIKVVTKWPVSTAINLSIPGCQRPWLGRAACCIEKGISENITRIAWWKLSIREQDKANEIADNIINDWRKLHLIAQQDILLHLIAQ